ncbi:MAG: DUF2909 domain-containing protein [Methylomonas sp.]|nr:DUF2909 domain-containing protein [Methylomonas sp.]PPD20083.1 MAG: hypothetical protein CTY23_10015 [Methylomonas sp.]PPD26008.1 MAG: hypothetical protein CTY22_06605 [Methylomonas sp.]PPD37737.1 MAG: hypothetical protein CTY21_06600 [Methylomonas sp.]PPD39615.1 MAG: hypothetical protein CTY17_07845 [Methylomonas sp.]
MLIKVIFVILFVVIIASLGLALFHLVKHKDQDQEIYSTTVRALTLRIALSLVLFLLLFAALSLGLFQPQGIGARFATPPAQPQHSEQGN